MNKPYTAQFSHLLVNRNGPVKHTGLYYLQVHSDAMKEAGIKNGDIVLVDRSIKPENGKVIIAILNGEMLIRRLEKRHNRVRLLPETPLLGVIDIDERACDFFILGVVTYVMNSVA